MKNNEISLTTKQTFAKALKQLMGRQPFETITVRQLLAITAYTRPTFYYHFHSTTDLLKWTFVNEALSLLQRSPEYHTWDEDIFLLLKYLKANEKQYRSFYATMDLEQMNRIFREPIQTVLIGYIDYILRTHHLAVSKEDQDFIVRFFTGGFVSIVVDWLNTGLKTSPEFIRQQILDTQDNIIIFSLETANKKNKLNKNGDL